MVASYICIYRWTEFGRINGGKAFLVLGLGVDDARKNFLAFARTIFDLLLFPIEKTQHSRGVS